MTPSEIKQVIEGLEYECDIRSPPNEIHRARFCTGWEDAAIRNRSYSEPTLRCLTWQNLGYRFGTRSTTNTPAQMHAVFDALVALYVASKPGLRGFLNMFPDELGEPEEAETFREGAKRTIIVDVYERDATARRRCIDHYGDECFFCKFSFVAAYGEIAEGFIHVHHLRPLAEIGEEYEVDPVKDLRPVCPNCHAVLHLHKPALSIEEMQALMADDKPQTANS